MCFQTNSGLTSLSLKGSRVGDGGALALARALKQNNTLSSLNLRACQVCRIYIYIYIASRSIVHLKPSADGSPLIDPRPRLTHPNAPNAQLHSEGISSLSAMLVENRVLNSLDLSTNRVTLDGVREMARALRLNASLATLRLEEWQDTFDNEQVSMRARIKGYWLWHIGSDLIYR